MAEEVVLFGTRGSPYTCRIEIALKLKGVQYKYIDEDLANKSPSLLKYNPVHKKVPVLVHNGKPVLESLVILEYIDETWQGYPILPEDPYERATARFWAKFIDEKCFPAIFKSCWGEEREREKAVEEVSVVLKILEDELKEKKFFGGENVGLVDIVAVVIGFSLGVYEEAARVELLNKEKLPRLCNWIDDFLSNSFIKESLPPRDKLIAYLRNRFRSGNASK
ncbi:probable glutathione S-transferase [Quercus robur]|uniref:probable glutathione S-transferase n=1 Tax=Quercus robur TaxID=38942 RepID=UPI002162EB12|nr:probable glutathione S-transferase [Quercus robur]